MFEPKIIKQSSFCGFCKRITDFDLIQKDEQEGIYYKCEECGIGSLIILPENPLCGCNSQPCEHTKWKYNE